MQGAPTIIMNPADTAPAKENPRQHAQGWEDEARATRIFPKRITFAGE
jgi:hypothetical protein